jgi:putative ABC transport system ATP-binding protein
MQSAGNSKMIEMRDVWRLYRMGSETINALAGVNLDVARGDFISIVGPSGSGKSTLLNVVGGLDLPTSGRIEVEGQDLTKANDGELSHYRNRKLGFIFQTFNLQPTYSTLENVALPLVFAKVPPGRRNRTASELLGAVGLSDRAGHTPGQLSGGERQRVAIARALANDPSILLADEPTGNLDSKTSDLIVDLLTRLSRERGITLLLVTHNLRIAEHADRIVHMADGQIVD